MIMQSEIEVIPLTASVGTQTHIQTNRSVEQQVDIHKPPHQTKRFTSQADASQLNQQFWYFSKIL
jgi:hypothetical protein